MRRRLPHFGPLVLLLLGIAMGVFSAQSVQRQAQEELETNLKADATEFAMLFRSLAGGFESELVALRGIALAVDDPVVGHRAFIETNEVDAAHALVDLSGPDPIVLHVGSSGLGDDALDETRQRIEAALTFPAVEADVRGLVAGNEVGVIDVPDGDAILFATAGRNGDVVLADIVLVELGGAAQVAGSILGSIDEFAIYATEAANPDKTVLASTNELPLRGTVAREPFDYGSRTLLIEVSGTAETPIPPWVVLTGWIGVMGLISAALLMALRRGDAAVAAKAGAEQAERRLRAVLDGSPDLVVLWEAATRSLRVLNRDDVFGHPIDSVSAPGALDRIVHPDDRHLLRNGETSGLLDRPEGVDVRIHTADGDLAWANIRLRWIPSLVPGGAGGDGDGDGEDLDVIAVITDTTEAHEVAEHRARLEAELQQAQRIESVGQLAGGIAHDFNNLLAAISSTAELIADDVDDPRTGRDVEEIIRATRRGAALTRRLLTFSKRSAERHVVVDVNEVVGELSAMLRRTISEEVEFRTHLAEGLLPVVGDAGEIEQVLTNLVINARDASVGRNHWIRVETRRAGSDAIIEVSDAGAGMTEEVRTRAFEPFFSTKQPDQGTGLGLSIVYGIVHRMGGSITVTSAPGQGTTVAVTVPLAQAPQAAPVEPEPAAADHQGPASGEQVLLVEDEPAVRRAAARLIERDGHHVVTAADGIEAVGAVEQGFHPTVLVTDVVLPGAINGRDVAAQVRRLVPTVRVVYASGYARDLIDAETLEAEHALFVAKPFTSATLLASVRGHQSLESV